MKPYGVKPGDGESATDTSNSGIGVKATGNRASRGGRGGKVRSPAQKSYIRAAKKAARRVKMED
jgi:hypothetical protein